MTSLLAAKGVGRVAVVNRYLPQIDLWVDAVGGTAPGSDYLSALSTFVSRGVADGWATTCPGIFPFCAPLEAGSRVSVTDITKTLTKTGTLSHAPYYGLTGDAATGYLEGSAADAAAWWDADHHAMGVFSQTGLSDDGTCGASSSGARLGMALLNSSSRFQIWPGAGTTSLTANVKPAQGAFGVVRTSSSDGFYGYGGVTTAWSQASVGLPTGNMRFFRFVNSFSQNELAFGFFGQMTTAQFTSFSNACLEMLSTLGTLRDAPTPEIIGSNCFEVQEPSATPSRQYRLARRPASDAEDKTTYAAAPVTDVHGELSAAVLASTDTRIGFWIHTWNDRARTAGKKDNGIDGRVSVTVGASTYDGRLGFSTYRKAIGSTLIKSAYAAGLLARNDTRLTVFQATTRGAGWGFLDIADYYGYDTSGWAAYSSDTDLYTDVNLATGPVAHAAYYDANAASVFTTFYENSYVAVDKVALHRHRVTELDSSVQRGLWLDDETRDGRTNVEAMEVLKGLDQILGAVDLSFVASTNRKDSSASSGWDATTCAYAQTLANLQGTNIVISRTETDSIAAITTQINLFKGPLGSGVVDGSKLIMHAVLGPEGIETPIAYVQAGRTALLANSIAATHVTPGYAEEGGALTRAVNQIIATLNGLPTS